MRVRLRSVFSGYKTIPDFFSSHWQKRFFIPRISLSLWTVSAGCFIVGSASFMRQVVDFLRNRFVGIHAVEILIAGMIIFAIGTFLFFLGTRRIPLIKRLGVLVVLGVGLWVIVRLKLPIERVHILEYAVLGWIALGDTSVKHSKLNAGIIAGIFCATISVIDELFQGILPYRFFDTRDIMFNLIGVSEGFVLYFLSRSL